MSQTGDVDPICLPLTHSYRYQTGVVAASKNSMARPFFAKYACVFALVLAFESLFSSPNTLTKTFLTSL